MNTNWSQTTRYIVGVSLALFGILVVYVSRSVIPYLVYAALIAVMVRPLIVWLNQRAKLPRGLSVTLAYLAMIMLVPLALLLTIPAIVDAVNFVITLDYQAIVVNLVEWMRVNLNALKTVQFPIPGLDSYIDQAADSILLQLGQTTISAAQAPSSVDGIIQSLGTAITTTFRTAAGVVGLLFSQLTVWLFIFLASTYISLDAHTYQETFLGIIPERFRSEISTLISRIVRTWNAFFRGELLLMLVIGTMSWVGLTILGVPGALYLAIVAGLLELIPTLGPIIATIPAVIVALLQGSNYLPVNPLVTALLVLLLYIVIQQLENSLIVPRILGEAVDLPALVVMTGVLVGAEVAGILGALLATPVIATLRELVRYAYRKILGEPPFPPHEKMPDPPVNPLQGLRGWLLMAARSLKPASQKDDPAAAVPSKRKKGK